MLASACPGWVCYAEKTHAAVLPNISTAKSPQVCAAVHRSFQDADGMFGMANS